MNFKQIEASAKNGTQFDIEFFKTLKTCQEYSQALRDNKKNGGNRKTEKRLRELVREVADTLRCFVNCCK